MGERAAGIPPCRTLLKWTQLGALLDLALHARTRAARDRDARRARQAGRARGAKRRGLDGLPLRVSSQSHTSLSRVAWLILECARRTSTFLSCAFREQEDGQATHPFPPARSLSL